MKISRLSSLTLGLAIAVFALGYANPSFADKPTCDNNTHCDHGDDGGSGGGDAGTTYTVNMEVTSLNTPIAVPCTGTADKRLGPSFGPNACKVSLTDSTYGTRNYCLFGVSVKNTNKGTRVMLFMARDCVANSDNGYHTLELVGELVLDPGEEAPDFHIVVNQPAAGADLTKINQPNKNVALDDKIFISDMVYTVDP